MPPPGSMASRGGGWIFPPLFLFSSTRGFAGGAVVLFGLYKILQPNVPLLVLTKTAVIVVYINILFRWERLIPFPASPLKIHVVF